MSTREENNQKQKRNARRANGAVVAIVFFFLDLVLFGVFGKAGNEIADFLIGIFGYAIYGYCLASTLLGVLMCFNIKPKQGVKIILLYVSIAVLVVMFAHILASHSLALTGWNNYIKQSYIGANTAGGAVASIFLYPFATKNVYILSLVANGIIAVGLIVIAILLQVNVDINLERFGAKLGRKTKVSSGQNANVGMFDVGYEGGGYVSLNNQTVDGRDLGERLNSRGRKGNLDNYVPIDRINVASEQNFDSMANMDTNGGIYAEDPQLILDTNEIRVEAGRNNDYIFAGEDVAPQYGEVDVSQAQRDIFGIDPSSAMNVVNEGIQDRQISESVVSPREQEDIDMSKYDILSTNERMRIIEDNERKARERREKEDSFVQQEQPKRSNFAEKLNSILNKRSEDNRDTVSESGATQSFDFDFGTPKSSFTEKKDVLSDAVGNVDKSNEEKPATDISASKKQDGIEEKKVVEDKSVKQPIESMDEFIAKTNKEKEQKNVTEIKNYHVTENIRVKPQEVKPSDGYFNKSYDPKPITPIAPKSVNNGLSNANSKPNILNGNAENKSAQNKTVEEKPQEKVKRSPYVYPSIDNLKEYNTDLSDYNEDFMDKAKIIENTYANFGIEVHVKNIVNGPTVTRFEFEVPPTIPVDKIPQKSKNILMALAVTSLRIEAPIPGKSLCGIEIPNAKRKTVGLKEFIASEEFKTKKGGLQFALGKDIDGKCYYADLTDFPHGLIAGGTGSGKSVCLNTMLCSLIYKYSPEQLRIILVDPKRVEFGKYKELPHLLTPKIYNTPKESLNILRWLVDEMTRRYTLFEQYFVNKISTYNSLDEVIADQQTIPYIVTIIDEVGDIMVSEYAKEFESLVLTLTQKARACGIHLILATQRPSVDVITGTIKVNLPTRIAFAVTSGVDSKTILDSIGAEDLLGMGDMLYKTTKSRFLVRLQNPFIDDLEIKNIMVDITKHNQAYYDENIIQQIMAKEEPPKKEETASGSAKPAKEFDFPDELCPDVLRRIVSADKVSISFLQRAFTIGFPRGGKIFDWLLANSYIEKVADNKYVCRLSSEQVEEIIEGARNGGESEEE